MNIRLNDVIAFVTGAAIGAVVTYNVMKKKYDEILEAYTTERDVDFDEDEYFDEVTTVPNVNAIDDMRNIYNNISREAGYTQGYVEDKEEENVPGPYIISPEDFDENGYNTESLEHYADGTLTDQMGNIIDYPEELIGDIDPAKHYGEYEQDSVFIRNDAKQCDYEILRDTRTYEEMLNDIG